MRPRCMTCNRVTAQAGQQCSACIVARKRFKPDGLVWPNGVVNATDSMRFGQTASCRFEPTRFGTVRGRMVGANSAQRG